MTARASKQKKMTPRDYCVDQLRWNKTKKIASILQKNTGEKWSASRVLRDATDLMELKDTARTVREFLIK